MQAGDDGGDGDFLNVQGEGVVDGEVLHDLTGAGEEGHDGEEGYEEMDDDDEEGPSTVPERDDAVAVFSGHNGEAVYCVAWSPVSGAVVSGGGDDRGFLWRADNPSSCAELAGHSDSVSCAAFSEDGALVATGGMDGRVLVWDASTGARKSVCDGPGDSIEWLAWHPKGHVVLAGSADFTAWMWNADAGTCMQVFSGHSDAVSCGRFVPDGRAAVTGSLDGTVRVWTPRTGECAQMVDRSSAPFHEAGILCLDVHADGQACLTGGEDGAVFVSNLATGRPLGSLAGGHEDTVETAGFCPLLPIAATGDVTGKLCLWDMGSMQMRGVCAHPEGKAVVRLRWHPSAPLAVTACVDGCVRVWDCRTATCVIRREGHVEPIMDLALSSDGSACVTASDDGTARAFSLQP